MPWRIVNGRIVYVSPGEERRRSEKKKGNPRRGRVANTGPCGMGDDLELV